MTDAWEDYTSNCQDEITTAFKKCEMFNDMEGRENHLVKLDKFKDYMPPKKDDKLETIIKKKKGRKKISR